VKTKSIPSFDNILPAPEFPKKEAVLYRILNEVKTWAEKSILKLFSHSLYSALPDNMQKAMK